MTVIAHLSDMHLDGSPGRLRRFEAVLAQGNHDLDDALGLLPYGNGVHYDAGDERRTLLHALVQDGMLPLSFASDNGVGLLYEGTDFVEAVSERDGAGAYRVERTEAGEVVETRIEPRLLGGV